MNGGRRDGDGGITRVRKDHGQEITDRGYVLQEKIMAWFGERLVPFDLAAEIIKALDREGLSVRAAHARTGIAAADFSRIRNANLGRFTVDRLMSIINRLGARVEVNIRLRPAPSVGPEAAA
jgi:predicted XRE-type DNA-binding protein